MRNFFTKNLSDYESAFANSFVCLRLNCREITRTELSYTHSMQSSSYFDNLLSCYFVFWIRRKVDSLTVSTFDKGFFQVKEIDTQSLISYHFLDELEKSICNKEYPISHWKIMFSHEDCNSQFLLKILSGKQQHVRIPTYINGDHISQQLLSL